MATATEQPTSAQPGAAPSAPVPVLDLLSDAPPLVEPSPRANDEPTQPTGFRSSLMAAAGLAPQRVQSSSDIAKGVGSKKQVSYRQLSLALKESALTPELRKVQYRMKMFIFPKLAVYNAVDPALALALTNLLQNCGESGVLRYTYYFAARILSESGDPSNAPGGSVPAPNFAAIRVDVLTGQEGNADEGVSQLLAKLVSEASTVEPIFHGRRMAALKALASVPLERDDVFEAIVKIISLIFDKVMGDKKGRRRITLFRKGGQDKDSAIKSNLHYAALSTLRRLPLDPENVSLVDKIVLGIGCSDPVGARHALAMAFQSAISNPVGIAAALARYAGGSMAEVIKCKDVFAKVYLARLCGTLIHSDQLYERSDWRGLFSAVLFQLLYDSSQKVVFEATMAVSGSVDGEASASQRAYGWQILTSSFTEGVPEKDEKKAGKKRGKEADGKPDLVLQLVVDRLDEALSGSSRPALHAALRVVCELGKAHAAAYAFGYEDDEEIAAAPSNDYDDDFAQAMGRGGAGAVEEEESVISLPSLLSRLMEAVRMSTACECVFVRSQALKAMLWMQTEYDPIDELVATLQGELQDPSYTPDSLNDLLYTLHLRFKLSPGMAVKLLELANLFVTHVPEKVDIASIQAIWKMCLVGCGAEGKHLALEAVTAVLDRPPPPPLAPGSKKTFWTSQVSNPASAAALQRLLQSAIWFLGENANYAAAEYAWEGGLPPAALMMMLDNDRRVAASGTRNPTLAAAIARLQRCIAHGSWEERCVASNALVTLALRSGEPYRLQIYEYFHALIYGDDAIHQKVDSKRQAVRNGEVAGATGSGLQSIISPMLRVLDEMYQAQDVMMREIQQHDISKEPWKEEELKKVYDAHERLMDLTLLFCFVPRGQYLPLGPVSAPLINRYRNEHSIDANVSPNEEAIKESLSKLLSEAGGPRVTAQFPPVTLLVPLEDVGPQAAFLDQREEDDSVSAQLNARAVNFDAIWASSLVEDGDENGEEYVGDDNESDDDDSEEESNFGSSYSQSQSKNLQNWDEESLSGREGGGLDSLATVGRGIATGSNFDEAYETELRQSYEGKERRYATAAYEFFAQDDDELSLRVGDDLEIEYEVDGWYFVRKKNSRGGEKVSGLVPVMYVR